ncbi:MAG TPA: PQQ-binding-like beta-propeller repeat protein [Thermoanaerobaculia bacterium]|nr:PQQ-binding-like beta-propeller repeat protein [Thermoanaerobaculia bacterium]
MARRFTTFAAAALAAVSMGNMALAADWPQWRGPARDGVAASFKAPKTWPEKLGKVWSVEVGGGHSSPVVAGGRIFLHSRQGDDEVVSALDLASGKVLWRDSYPASFKPAPEAQRHGQGPFSTPTFHDGRLYAFGVNGILSAYDAASGKLAWRRDFGKDFPTPRPYYGTSLSPLLTDGLCIVYAGGPGKGALFALDAKTGGVKWRLDGDGSGYGSPVVATFGGVRQVIVPTQQAILGASLADGKLLWQMPFKIPYDQNILTPVVFEDTLIVSGEDTDAQAIRVAKRDGKWATEKVWSNRPSMMYMSSPVLSGGLLYGFATTRKGHLFSLNPKTGEVRWATQGGEGDHASLVAAGDVLFVLGSNAELDVVQRTGEGYKRLARYTVADSPTWAYPVVLDGRLLVKDANRLTLWSLS